MAFDWIRVDVDMVDHPKVKALARETGNPLAGWFVLRAWAWAARFAPSGRVPPGQLETFENSIRGAVHGDRWSGRLLSQLESSGLLDRLEDGSMEVHDWHEMQSKVAEKAVKDAERQRKHREKKRDVTHVGAVTKASTRRDETDVTDETNIALQALAGIYREIRGALYAVGKDDREALASMLALARNAEEIEARWRIALTRTSRDKFQSPKVHTLSQLAREWNAFPVAVAS